MFRSSDRGRGVVGGALEDNLATLTGHDDDQLSDDDNAAPGMESELDEQGLEQQAEDPFQLALEDLEGRVVTVLDDVKLHPGVRSNDSYKNIQDELASLLRPVMEVAAHTAPSIARTYYQGVGAEGVEASCEEVYQRVVSDLVLPVLLEMAQSDTIPAKRGAALEFFRGLFKECQKPGSWLDVNHQDANAGPYGNGTTSSSSKHHHHQRQPPAQLKRRQAKRLQREGEMLRYWVQASIACTTPGVFTSEASEVSVASRGVIAASASIRPSLKHIAQRIRDTDDRGANKVFVPVMKMVEGVLKKLFLSNSSESENEDSLRSSCIKFLEILCLCCSAKPKDASSRRKGHTTDDFSLADLPAGHPIITRQALESIADFAFSAMRGLTMMGGQVKIDTNLLADLLMGEASGLPTAPVVSILKPAALGYLEIEASLPSGDAENALDINIDRSTVEYDFVLSHKSYALAVNAVSALASHRPVFFKDGAICLARRCSDPPTFVEDEGVHNQLSKPAVLATRSQLRASCLTLLRNALSVQTKASFILHKVLKEKCDMEIQADKALKMAEQTTALKTAGRAARNKANMFYEWDTSATDERTSKRQQETDDALAKMRAAKAKRGLGHGIQLPTSMTDAIELVVENLKHLPSKRPGAAASKKKSVMTLDFFVDAIMTNGASLAQEEGRWYARDGGTAWNIDLGEDQNKFSLNSKLSADDTASPKKKKKDKADVEAEQKKIFDSQCKTAASDALGRIVVNSLQSRNDQYSEFASNVAARLAWTLQDIPPSSQLAPAHEMALESIESAKKQAEGEEQEKGFENLASSFPLAASCLALPATSTTTYGPGAPFTDGRPSLSNSLLNEAYLQGMCETSSGSVDENGGSWKYETSLDIFVSSVAHASKRCNDKPADADRKRVATDCANSIQKELGILPQLSSPAMTFVSAMCDLDDITKKAAEASRKTSQQTIAAAASLNAAKQAAEKRANKALLVIRDACFQRSNAETRKGAIRAAVGLAAGQMNASKSCEDKALKMVINMLYPRSQMVADGVVEAATDALKNIASDAQANYTKIQKANRDAKENDKEQPHSKSPYAPKSEEEKEAMDKARKPVVLFMALCIRRPELIRTLFEVSSQEEADVLTKTVQQSMPKLARAVGTQNGPAEVAIEVADNTTTAETPLLLSLLDALAPLGEKGTVSQEFIDACYKIQEKKAEGGRKNPRFLIPVVFAIKREELKSKLPEFVEADDDVFMAALIKMSERLQRQVLLFRDEPDPEEPSLKGMTHCEQLVYLHNLDFEAAGLPQRRYLDATRLCLENEEVFNDRVVMAALDHMSGMFLTGEEPLPLAFMRTVILVCSKHESLHSWICHTLLPRLIEGKIYEDKRQWEGWMRCAKMLESSGDTGVSSEEAIQKLPPEQLAMYKDRYGK